MRILLVSQMYPGAADPDLGVFVRQLEEELARRGHDLERVVIDRRRGGKRRFAGLAARTPGAPLVVTAHGRDVRNIGAIPGVGTATRLVARRAVAIVAVSEYLRQELETKVPEARGKVEVIDCGVDLERFRVERAPERPTRYLCVGSLTARKNVVRLADAFARIGQGTLTFVGDGPLRAQLDGREGVILAGPVPHDDVPAWIAQSHVVCQPSLVEPFGLVLLEAMASGRSVVATRVGGPPEFVTAEAGVLVDPTDEDGARPAA